MTAGPRVASFGALLVAIFALAALAGRATGPIPPAGSDSGSDSGHGSGSDPGAGAGAGAGEASHDAAAASAEDELRLVVPDTTLIAGRSQRLRFTIQDARGEIARDFEVEQGRRMHLIVVRRDLRRFQHLHPTQDASGAWSTHVTLPDAGVYQAFADFQIDATRRALGADLFAAGRFEPLALPAASATASAEGYDVALHRSAGRLRFSVSRDGEPVDLQPYLGARGHLVMLRAGDLAYAHVHPLTPRGLVFDAAGAAPGIYRLFLQFRHADRVHTVGFTHELTP
jgi:hypothetical protein